MNAARGLLALLAVMLASGCALNWESEPSRPAYTPPEPEPAPERAVGPGEYMVRRGDTVYSIAFRNTLDFRDLAKWNGIGSNYLIRPGQVLRLSAPPPTEVANGWIVSRPIELNADRPVDKPRALPSEPLAMPPEDVRTTPPPVRRPPGAKPGTPARPVPLPPQPPVASIPLPPLPSSTTPRPVVPPPPVTSESGGAYQWQWPTEGVVVRGFNPAAGSKGLDFAGDAGQRVVAAAPGKVVYSGSALKGYGELIILKHDDLRLSAYGYNRKRLVQEGQMVRGGEVIAELGFGPENKPILHFEIRERGQPVNPVPYLPARR